jgi:hypothetical protein
VKCNEERKEILMKIQAWFIRTVGIAVAACTLAGCSSPAFYVRKDPSVFPGKPIMVHILGVTEDEKRTLDAKSQGYWAYEYWTDGLKTGFPIPATARHEKQVTDCVVLTAKDPIWSAWKSRRATDLLVVGDIPLNDGLWCVSVPFEPQRWEDKTATVVIGPKGLSVGATSE